MRAAGQMTDQAVPANDQPVECPELTLALEFSLGEAEALRAWLLKSTADGMTALDDLSVSRALASLGQAVDSARAVANVRSELEHAGLGVDHLTDEQVRELGRRVTEAAQPAIRA